MASDHMFSNQRANIPSLGKMTGVGNTNKEIAAAARVVSRAIDAPLLLEILGLPINTTEVAGA